MVDFRPPFVALFAALACLAQLQSLRAETQAPTPGEPGELINIGDEGPILFFLPCWNCRWKEFEPFMNANSDAFRMYAVTYPGQGGTALPDLPFYSDQPIWTEYTVQSVVNVLEQHDLNDVTLVASSWGVKIAIAAAHRTPERVTGVINLDGQPIYSKSLMSYSGDAREFDAGALAVARKVRDDYIEPTFRNDPDAWQRLNWVTLEDPVRRMLTHGWFMATPKDVTFNIWFENIVDLEAHNARFSALKVPFLDARALRPSWDAEQRQVRRDAYSLQSEKEGVELPEYYEATWIEGSDHLTPLSRPDLMRRIVDDFVSGREIPAIYE